MAEEHERMRARASVQATDWLIALQEAPGDAGLRRRFEAWRRENPLNAEAWAETGRVADAIGAVPPAHAGRWRPFVAARGAGARRDLHRVPRRAARRGRPPARRRALAFAALAAAACLALLLAPDALLRIEADHATGTGETRTVRLADGSAVTLAPGSAIAVRFAGRERRVDLLAGEAFFEAAANPARPFRVVAGPVGATVLGTAFDVRRTGDGAAVAVAHGTVRVDDPGATPPVSETLRAGQSVRVGRAGAPVRHAGSPEGVAAWREGRLVARDEPMGEVVDRLRRHYGGAIVLADPALADRSVTGIYNLADPVDAVRAVARAHGANARRLGPVLVITGF